MYMQIHVCERGQGKAEHIIESNVNLLGVVLEHRNVEVCVCGARDGYSIDYISFIPTTEDSLGGTNILNN